MNRLILPFILFAGAFPATGAVIVGISSISYTGTATEATDFPANDENNLINGSGLSAPVTVANIATVTHGSAATNTVWTTNAPGGGDFFVGAPGVSVVFDIVFDGTYDITQFASWSYGFGANVDNNISQVKLDYGIGDFANTSLGAFSVGKPASFGPAVIVNLASTITADRVRITVLDNHFGNPDAPAGGDRVSLAEIRFVGDAVPEPSGALLGTCGLLGLLRRRR